MTVVYRDEIGYKAVKVDGSGIDFLSGKAYFSDGEKDYVIDVKNVVRIVNE